MGLGLLAIVAFKPSESKPVAGVQKWEYMSVIPTVNQTKMQDAFNKAGQEGWEYVGLGTFHWFKRPVE